MARSRDRRNTPAEVAKKGPPCDIKEVHKEWDNDDNIRNRLREGGTFLEPGTVVDAENIQNAVTNKNTLMPLLCRMSVLDRRPLPAVEDLRDEINETLTANKRVGQGEVKMIMESASTLKKLCSFLKMKCRRKEVSSEGDFQLLCLALDPMLQVEVDNVNAKRQSKEQVENENADEDEYNEEGAGQGEEGEEEEPLEVDEEVPVETGPPSEVVAVSAPAANGETGVGQSGNKENPGKEVKTAKDKPQEERTGDNQESGTNKAPKTKEENDANTDRKTRDENTAKQNPAQAGKEPSEGEKPLEGKETNDKAGQLEKNQKRREEIQARLAELQKLKEARVATTTAAGKQEPGLGSSSDDADTLPQDIRTVPVPHDKSPEWTSPELSAKTRRSKYQGVKTAEEEKESLEKVENKKNDGVLAHKQEPSQKVIEKKKEEATDKATESDAEEENFVRREDQLRMKPERGRGRGKGKGRGRGNAREKNAGPGSLRGKGRGGGNPKRNASGGSKPSGATAAPKTAKAKNNASKTGKAKQTDENQSEWWEQEWTEEWDHQDEEWAWGTYELESEQEPAASSRSKTKKPQKPKPKRATKSPRAAKKGETKADASNTDDAIETPPPKKKAKTETKTKTEENPKEKKKEKTSDKRKAKEEKDNADDQENAEVKPKKQRRLVVTNVQNGDECEQVSREAILEFCRQFKTRENKDHSEESKSEIKNKLHLDDSHCTYNIYWRRPAVGAHSLDGSTIQYFAYSENTSPWLYRAAAMMKAAELLASHMEEIIAEDQIAPESHLKDNWKICAWSDILKRAMKVADEV
ncbi:unnamed protein product [Cladocopium goreaui]|uniref:Uncharacterized protein n=1 Tax=Cladocopium goreaui TaxID=2562237 RepID=A0A9P1BLH3_9DINO|nr:unnamed protein product [Cladocopium goreaui]